MLHKELYSKDFKLPGRRPRVSPMSVINYVTEGESRRGTHPELERQRVYEKI
jgi:hypothetical protein